MSFTEIGPPYRLPELRPFRMVTNKIRLTGGAVVTEHGDLSSDDYLAGLSGWVITGDGDVEFNNGTFRGTLDGADGTFSGNLEGATVTGGLIRTDDVGARVELSEGQSGRISFYGAGGGLTGFIDGSLGGLGEMTIDAIAISITAPVTVTSSLVAAFGLSVGGTAYMDGLNVDGSAEIHSNLWVWGDLTLGDGFGAPPVLNMGGGTISGLSTAQNLTLNNLTVNGAVGSLTMNGNIDMNGYTLYDANSLAASSSMAAPSVSANNLYPYSGGSVQVNGNLGVTGGVIISNDVIIGGVLTLSSGAVSRGAVNSAGSGFRYLRVPN